MSSYGPWLFSPSAALDAPAAGALSMSFVRYSTYGSGKGGGDAPKHRVFGGEYLSAIFGAHGLAPLSNVPGQPSGGGDGATPMMS